MIRKDALTHGQYNRKISGERGQIMELEHALTQEIVLNEIRRNQDRLVFYLSVGFMCGFVIGVTVAWLFINL
jgi:hypothetical protein